MMDVFEDRPEFHGWRGELLNLIRETPHLDWLLLTKRPENIERLLEAAATEFGDLSLWTSLSANLAVGTSVENQAVADERIPTLLKIPAAIRFLSTEPLLGPVDLDCMNFGSMVGIATRSILYAAWSGATQTGKKIDWIIVGGESGPNARPCNVEWIRLIVKQCKVAGVPVFVKQFGSHPVGRWTKGERAAAGEGWPAGMKIKHPKGGDPREWPEDLRVRELPRP
jgi:protein gp37